MPQRSDPQILADLIRLHNQNEQRMERAELHGKSSNELRGENDLIENARAALHYYVTQTGQAVSDAVGTNKPRRRGWSSAENASPSALRAPINLWTSAVYATGIMAQPIALAIGVDTMIALAAGVVLIVGASIVIDRKQL